MKHVLHFLMMMLYAVLAVAALDVNEHHHRIAMLLLIVAWGVVRWEPSLFRALGPQHGRGQ